MKVILSPNPYRDKRMSVVREAEKVLRECGVQTVMCLPFQMGDNFRYPKEFEWRDLYEEAEGTDMLICFGGDGTILHLARYAKTYNIPILGVNTGSLGYMAELEPGEVKLLRRIVTGDYRLEPHMMVDFRVHRGKKVIYEDTALNEAVIKTSSVGQEIHFTIYADGVELFACSGDGVIVGTPTGSTAYNVSAGGPIVEPTAENLLVTPICAHDLRVRPCVLSKERVVEVQLEHIGKKGVYLSADGGAFRLSDHDRVELRSSQSKINLVRLTDRSFYEILHQKLGS
ncbi:MAG: NAD(+)/NADH kinase [Candidatus Onthomonas sp.]|nr:NAD(+)/NADH kinase [Candidatus Onthomonas sp.]